MSNISHVCRSCSSCFLQAAIGGTGTGSITTSTRLGFYPLGHKPLWQRQQFQNLKAHRALSGPSNSLSVFGLLVCRALVFNSPLTASTPKACQKHTFSRPRSQYSNICVGGGPSQLLQGGRLRGAKHGNNKWKNKFNSQHTSPQSFSEDIRNCSTSQINISGRNVSIARVDPRIKFSHSKVQEVVRLEHVCSYC